MKLRRRLSKVSNHSSQLTSRSFSSLSPKSKRSTPRWSPCSVPSTVAGTPPRLSAHWRITSWCVVTRLRPWRSGSSSVEVTSCEYFRDRDVSGPVRTWPSSGPAPSEPLDPEDDDPPEDEPTRASTSSSLRMSDWPATPASRAMACSSSTFFERSSVSLTPGVFGVWLPGFSAMAACYPAIARRHMSVRRDPFRRPRTSAGDRDVVGGGPLGDVASLDGRRHQLGEQVGGAGEGGRAQFGEG